LSGGLVMMTLAVWVASFWLLLAAAILGGAGMGALFRGAIATVIAITPPEVRAEGLAGMYLGTYIGVTVAVVGLGVATLWLSMPVAVLGFAVALTAGIAAVTPHLFR